MANYNLTITQPQAGLTTSNRFYKAYPGLQYNVRMVVKGGLFPYHYKLMKAPSGMTIDQDGEITWANPTVGASPATVLARVVDSEGTAATVTWTVTVTTSGFYFVDINAANGGTGTISDPWNKFADFYVSINDTSYQDGFVYFRAGTYPIPSTLGYDSAVGSNRVHFRHQPHVYMAYPGESVTFNHYDGTAYSHLYIEAYATHWWFDGITFNNGYSYGIEIWGGTNFVIRNCTFQNMTSDNSSGNQAAISIRNDALWDDLTQHYSPPTSGGSYKENFAILDNTFSTFTNGVYGIDVYGTHTLVIQGNTFSSFANRGINLKSTSWGISIIGNTFGAGFQDAINMSCQYYVNDVEVLYNKLLSNFRIGDYENQSGPGLVYVYRNTVVGEFNLTYMESDDGPIYISNNVIINSTPADHIQDETTEHWSITADKSVLVNNLTGAVSDSIVDGSGNLTGSYTSYLGTAGYQQVSVSLPNAPSSVAV